MKEKKVADSSVTLSIIMQPQDANMAGNVHGGVIMKHIDDAAGMVALRHAGRNVVTASIDRLDFHNPAFIGNLLTFQACLNMVGKTSMEIGVRVEAENLVTGEVRHTNSAYLTMVALDDKRKPTPVPQITPETEHERRRFTEGKARADRRKELRKKSSQTQ